MADLCADVSSDACTEMSVEMHDAALFTFGYVFGHVRRTKEIVTMMTASAVAG